jgi:hypothetical protein
MNRLSGLELLEERDGEGRPAQKGDRVMFNMRFSLNRGDEVPFDEVLICETRLRDIVGSFSVESLPEVT